MDSWSQKMADGVAGRPEVQEFVDAAKNYCELIDGIQRSVTEELVPELAAALSQLYAAAWGLPDVEPSEQCDVSRFEVSWDDIPDLPGLGKFETYRDVFDPYEDATPLEEHLSRNLREVYQDVKRGLLRFEAGSAEDKLDAVWEWKFLLMTHWGSHALTALRALHWANWHLDLDRA